MKKYFKYSILITLTILILLTLAIRPGFAPADAPVRIGVTEQVAPYESNPQEAWTHGNFIAQPLSGLLNARDGDLATSASIAFPSTSTSSNFANFEKTSATTQSAIASIDVRIKYQWAGSSIGTYALLLYIGTNTVTLQAATGAAWDPVSIRTFTSVGRPGGGNWAWTDFSTANGFRITLTRTTTGTIAGFVVYEVWFRVNPVTPGAFQPEWDSLFPPSSSYDGRLSTSAKIGGFNQFTGWFSAGTFFNYNPNTGEDPFPLPIQWVDLKLALDVPSTLDDQYRITYSVLGTAAANPLIDWTTASITFQSDTIAQTFQNLTEPNDNAWDWTDINGLELFFEVQVVGDEDFITYTLSEIWLSVYPAPAPPSASTTISIQPGLVAPPPYAGGIFFIDIYVMQVEKLLGWQMIVEFDTSILTPVASYTYAPWNTRAADPLLDDANGLVALSYLTFDGDAFGFTGSSPIARIYFSIDADGVSTLHIPTSSASDILSDVLGKAIPHTTYDGIYGSVPEFPLGIGVLMVFVPLIPIVYIWRLRKKSR